MLQLVFYEKHIFIFKWNEKRNVLTLSQSSMSEYTQCVVEFSITYGASTLALLNSHNEEFSK